MIRKKLQKALEQVALANGVSVSEVRYEIQEIIYKGLSDPDPAVRAKWVAVPCRGAFPTPEELLDCLSRRVIATKPQPQGSAEHGLRAIIGSRMLF